MKTLNRSDLSEMIESFNKEKIFPILSANEDPIPVVFLVDNDVHQIHLVEIMYNPDEGLSLGEAMKKSIEAVGKTGDTVAVIFTAWMVVRSVDNYRELTQPEREEMIKSIQPSSQPDRQEVLTIVSADQTGFSMRVGKIHRQPAASPQFEPLQEYNDGAPLGGIAGALLQAMRVRQQPV